MTLRQTLIGLVVAASPGCLLDTECTDHEEKTVHYADPPPLELQQLLQSCDADVDACHALCMKVIEEINNFNAGVEKCEETRRSDGSHDVTVGWAEATGNSGCPVAGRRPAGLRRGTVGARDAAGAQLARDAHFEAASVYAFLDLARELARHGAPQHLRDAALQAALDEVRHAKLMAAHAHARGARIAPVKIKRPRARSLEAIAIENAVEGIVGETWAALIATYQAAHAPAELRETYAAIAADEARHAELAREVAAWANEKLFPAARARVAMRQRRAVARISRHRAGAAELGMPQAEALQSLYRGARAALWS